MSLSELRHSDANNSTYALGFVRVAGGNPSEAPGKPFLSYYDQSVFLDGAE